MEYYKTCDLIHELENRGYKVSPNEIPSVSELSEFFMKNRTDYFKKLVQSLDRDTTNFLIETINEYNLYKEQKC